MSPLQLVTLAEARHAAELAQLHAQALPDDVLPALGAGFLRCYYTQAMAADSQALIGAQRAGRLLGFCQLSFAPLAAWPLLPAALLPVLRLALRDPAMLARGVRMAAPRPH
ncbi:MAG TPA: hypothetical protein VIY30_19000, partial [Burkholderiaceae bacterium]